MLAELHFAFCCILRVEHSQPIGMALYFVTLRRKKSQSHHGETRGFTYTHSKLPPPGKQRAHIQLVHAYLYTHAYRLSEAS